MANATEVAAGSTVLKATKSGAKSWNDPAVALKPILATPKRCKDTKEKPTAWSQKTFVVREVMPKDIKHRGSSAKS